jgi:CheY-like chemotaxis protein
MNKVLHDACCVAQRHRWGSEGNVLMVGMVTGGWPAPRAGIIARVSRRMRWLGGEALRRGGRGAEGARRAAAPARASTATARIVLVADDDPAVRLLVAEALRQSGYTVLEAADGEEAMAIAQRHDGEISLLISDIVMPRMGGRELAKRFAAARPETPVLLMSGSLGDAGLREQLQEDNMPFLAKPFALGSLMDKVREVCAPPSSER